MSGAVRPVPNAYLGTSEFAAAVLTILAATPHRPSLVVTPPDRRRGRGRRMQSPPVADLARELGIELHQTASVNEPDSVESVRASGAELASVCAFGQLIGEPLLSEVPMLNVHPSLLPRWRGAAPIERAIMAGDEVTGVCVMRLTAGLDSGPVALREEAPVGPDEDFGSLSARLAELGGRLLAEAFDRHGAGSLEFADQPDDGITYAEKIQAADRAVDPGRPAVEEARRIRALTPHVGAFAELAGGERLGLRGARITSGDSPVEAGALRADDEDGGLLLGCAEGALLIAEVQPQGGRWMSAADYLRGRGLPSLAPAPGEEG